MTPALEDSDGSGGKSPRFTLLQCGSCDWKFQTREGKQAHMESVHDGTVAKPRAVDVRRAPWALAGETRGRGGADSMRGMRRGAGA